MIPLAVVILISLSLAPAMVVADDVEPEIEYLLEVIGKSGCTFIRNGKEHSSEDAEAHLRMKYQRARKYVANAEQFIDRLASKSSWTGTAYSIQCAGERPQSTQAWLSAKLAELPAQSS